MKSTKFYLVITMCILSLLCSAGCGAQPNDNTTASSIPATPPPVSVPQTAPYTEQETEQGTVVTTNYFTVTLPAVWKNNYTIRYTTQNGSHYYRLVDATVGEEYGGHIFTFALYQDHLSGAETCAYYGTYLGVLQSDIPYMVVVESPTDLPVPEERVPVYAQMQETKNQVLSSFTATNNTTFTRTSFDNFRERAAMLHSPTIGKEVAELFTRNTGTALTYVGLCADQLVTEIDGITESRYNYTHHLYQDAKGEHYVIPLCFTTEWHTVIPTVYKVDSFPHITSVWSLDNTQFEQTYQLFLKNEDFRDGRYCFKDIDGEGVPELLILENTTLSVYELQDDSFALVDQFDGVTGTMTYRFGFGINYPGVFTQSVGGGQTQYGYLSLENQKLKHQIVATKDSPDPHAEADFSFTLDNQTLVQIATQDLPELQFEPILS
ncbi:MAG: hypothetical protein IKT68_01355 [Clostridia bacterium]|nr:hypothetical protein [Clostridia bacterium]